jgi:hypothetical protein
MVELFLNALKAHASDIVKSEAPHDVTTLSVNQTALNASVGKFMAQANYPRGLSESVLLKMFRLFALAPRKRNNFLA